MAIKIDANMNVEVVEVNGLKDLQREVGGMITYVGNVQYEGKEYQMLADEEGLMKMDYELNKWALLNANQMLMGNVLLCDEKEFN